MHEYRMSLGICIDKRQDRCLDMCVNMCIGRHVYRDLEERDIFVSKLVAHIRQLPAGAGGLLQ